MSRKPRAAAPPASRARGRGERRLRFDPASPEIIFLPGISDMHPNLRAEVYWQEEDFKRMIRARRLVCIKVKQLEMIHGPDVDVASLPIPGESRRGLGMACERRMGTLAERQESIQKSSQLIIGYQRSENFSYENLAKLSEKLSRQASEAATDIAARDREQVEDFDLHDDGGSCPVSPQHSPPGSPAPRARRAAPAAAIPHEPKSPAHAMRRARSPTPIESPTSAARSPLDVSFAGDSPLNDSLSRKSAVGLDVSRLIRVDSLTTLHDDVDCGYRPSERVGDSPQPRSRSPDYEEAPRNHMT